MSSQSEAQSIASVAVATIKSHSHTISILKLEPKIVGQSAQAATSLFSTISSRQLRVLDSESVCDTNASKSKERN